MRRCPFCTRPLPHALIGTIDTVNNQGGDQIYTRYNRDVPLNREANPLPIVASREGVLVYGFCEAVGADLSRSLPIYRPVAPSKPLSESSVHKHQPLLLDFATPCPTWLRLCGRRPVEHLAYSHIPALPEIPRMEYSLNQPEG